MGSDEQEFAAHHAACEAARRDVMRRLALATGLQRAVELAEKADPAAMTPLAGHHLEGLTTVP